MVNFNVTLCRMTSQHQFWAHAPAEEVVENKELLAESRNRYISFPGTFTPVSHFCRARLDNGLLCQRQDRLKVTNKRHTKGLSFYDRSVTLIFFLSCSVHSMVALFLEMQQVYRSMRMTDWGRSKRQERRGKLSLVRSKHLHSYYTKHLPLYAHILMS